MIVSDYTVCIGGVNMSFRMCGIMHDDRITDAYLDVMNGDARHVVATMPDAIAQIISIGTSLLEQEAQRIHEERQQATLAMCGLTRRHKPGYIYIIATIDKRYKIGRSKGTRRPYDIMTAQAIPSHVYAIYEVDDMLTEEINLHRMYKPLRIDTIRGNEWFKLRQSDLDDIHSRYGDRCVHHAIFCDL